MISGHRKRSCNITAPISREERILSIRETIKINKVLIHAAENLLDKNSPCSFQVYLRELDKKINTLRDERKSLIDSYNKVSNGEIPSLQQQQEELAAKLKQLKVDTPGKMESEARRMNKKVMKAEWLGKRIKDLEEQLRNENFDVDELLKQAADL